MARRVSMWGWKAFVAGMVVLVQMACRGAYVCETKIGCQCECALCGSTSDAGLCADVSVYSPGVGFCRQFVTDGPEHCDAAAHANADAGAHDCLAACDWLADRQPGRRFGHCKFVPQPDNPWFVGDDPVCRTTLRPLDAGL